MALIPAPLRIQVRFLNPAFLGDAEQAARWRTPPFKALLRQCWRMAYAQDCGYAVDVTAMRHAEGRLFGSAADEDRSSRSLLRLRLDRWSRGTLREWTKLEVIRVSEKLKVGADVYLGYGPVAPGPVLKRAPAIDAGEQHELAIGFDPRDPATIAREHDRLMRAIQLAASYGTVGGRSRNGWGSFAMEGVDEPANPPLRDWREALQLDWPHAIGSDERGALVWQSAQQRDWRAAMVMLARLRFGLRRQFPLKSSTPGPADRHWLAYPVTQSKVPAWEPQGDRSGRIPNSLRFRLRQSEDGMRALVVHIPCRPPVAYRPDPTALERVWHAAHQWMDGQEHFSRVSSKP